MSITSQQISLVKKYRAKHIIDELFENKEGTLKAETEKGLIVNRFLSSEYVIKIRMNCTRELKNRKFQKRELLVRISNVSDSF